MKGNPNKVLALLVGSVLLLVAVLIGISLTRSPVSLAKSTPAWTVQYFLKATLAEHSADAISVISPTSLCTVHDIERIYAISDAKVTLLKASTTGESAEVRVRVEFPSRDPFGDFSTEDHIYQLVRSGGKWLITGIPWPLYDCGRPVK